MKPADILSFAVMLSPAAIINIISLEHGFQKEIEKGGGEDLELFKNYFTLISNLSIVLGAIASYFVVAAILCSYILGIIVLGFFGMIITSFF